MPGRADPTSTAVAPDAEEALARCQALEVELNELKALYEQYFLGMERVPPAKKHQALAAQLKALKAASLRQTAVKFRVGNLAAKLVTYERMWERSVKEMEDGTYRRELQRARRHRHQEPRPGGEPEKSAEFDVDEDLSDLDGEDLSSVLAQAAAAVERAAPRTRAGTPAEAAGASPAAAAVAPAIMPLDGLPPVRPVTGSTQVPVPPGPAFPGAPGTRSGPGSTGAVVSPSGPASAGAAGSPSGRASGGAPGAPSGPAPARAPGVPSGPASAGAPGTPSGPGLPGAPVSPPGPAFPGAPLRGPAGPAFPGAAPRPSTPTSPGGAGRASGPLPPSGAAGSSPGAPRPSGPVPAVSARPSSPAPGGAAGSSPGRVASAPGEAVRAAGSSPPSVPPRADATTPSGRPITDPALVRRPTTGSTSAPPRPITSDGQPGSPRTLPTIRPPTGDELRAPARASSAGRPGDPPGGLSDQKIKAIYDAYVMAKRRCGEDTRSLTLDSVATTLRKQVPELMRQHNAKSVEFKVVIKDGKAVLRALPKEG